MFTKANVILRFRKNISKKIRKNITLAKKFSILYVSELKPAEQER